MHVTNSPADVPAVEQNVASAVGPTEMQAEGAARVAAEKQANGTVKKQPLDPVEEQVKGSNPGPVQIPTQVKTEGPAQGPALGSTERLTEEAVVKSVGGPDVEKNVGPKMGPDVGSYFRSTEELSEEVTMSSADSPPERAPKEPVEQQAEAQIVRSSEGRTVGSLEETPTKSTEEPTQRLATGAAIGPAGRTADESTNRLVDMPAVSSTVAPGVPPAILPTVPLAVPSDLPPAYSQVVSPPDSQTAAVSQAIPPGCAVTSADESARILSESPAMGPAVRPNNVVLPPIAFDWEPPRIPHNVMPPRLPYNDHGAQDPPNCCSSWWNNLLSDQTSLTCLAWCSIFLVITLAVYVVNTIF